MVWTIDALAMLKTLCGCFAGFSSPEAAWEARAAMMRKHGGYDVSAAECAKQAEACGWEAE